MIKLNAKKLNLKTVFKIGKLSITAMLVVVAGFIVISTLSIPGNYKMLVVLSGSMEPRLRSGDIILVKPQEQYKQGDIITVSDPGNPKVKITHRIVGSEQKNDMLYYITKGDANDSIDTEKRPASNVLGKVLISFPYIGYLVSFARTKTGLIVLIIIPATIIVYNEVLSIKNELVKMYKARKNKNTYAE